MNEEKKTEVINQAKKVVMKGDSFICKLCKNNTNFVVGDFKKFKEHLDLLHKISYLYWR